MRIESELAKLIRGDKPKTSPYDTSAEVLRVDNETGKAWIKIAGGVAETPADLTINAKSGDIVQVRVSGGNAFLVGNASAPPTDDTKAEKAIETTKVVQKEVEFVREVVADNIIATNAKFDEVTADTAKIHNLSADSLTAATVFVGDLQAEGITAESINADHADISTLKTDKADVKDLTAANAKIENLEMTKADISEIEADYAKIDLANVNNAYIKNGVFDTAAIVDEQVFTVTGNKATIKEINADNINVRNLNAKNLKIETADGYITLGDKKTPTKEFIDSLTEDLNDRIDGAIETFTSTAVPTLSNYPANQWGTADEKATHVGDVCYVVNDQIAQNGYCYRFTLSGSTFSWQLIKDSDVTAALQRLQTAEGKIGNIEAFDEEMSTFKTETEGDISTLQTKTTSLETSLGDKVDKTTFNQVSQKVDENSASITTLETNVSKKADSSTVTTLSNTVNSVSQKADANEAAISDLEEVVETKADGSTVSTLSQTVNEVKQTATSNSSKVSSLTTTLGTNADGTTKAGDIVHRTSAVEQDLSGFKSTVSSTYETKTDASSKLNTAKTYADGKASDAETNAKADTTEKLKSYYTKTETNSQIDQKADSINLSVSKTYETKTDASDKLTEAKGYTDGEISTAKAAIKVTTDDISSEVSKKVGNSEIISKINQSAETVQIEAEKVEFKGSVVFNAIKSQTDAAYDAKGSASAVQKNLNNLQIGGRNLVWDTRWLDIANKWSNWGTPTTREIVTDNGKRWLHLVTTATSYQGYSQNQGKRNGYGEIKAGDKVVISYSAYAKTAGQKCTVGCHWKDSNGTTVAQNWFASELTTTEKRYTSGVFTIPNNAVGFNVMVGDGTANAQELWISQVKIEFGTKATDWTPAPEDVDASIEDVADSAAEDLVSATDAIYQRIDNTDNEVASIQTDLAKAAARTDLNAIDAFVKKYLGDNGYVKINNQGLVITQGRFSVVITGDMMIFQDNGNPVAYLSNQKLFITKSEVTQEMKIANFVWTNRDGRLTLMLAD